MRRARHARDAHARRRLENRRVPPSRQPRSTTAARLYPPCSPTPLVGSKRDRSDTGMQRSPSVSARAACPRTRGTRCRSGPLFHQEEKAQESKIAKTEGPQIINYESALRLRRTYLYLIVILTSGAPLPAEVFTLYL